MKVLSLVRVLLFVMMKRGNLICNCTVLVCCVLESFPLFFFSFGLFGL